MTFNPVTEDLVEFDKNFPPTMDPVIFSSEDSKIVGTMFVANGEGPHPVVLLLHGFPGNETNFDLAHSFRRAGFNVLIFHYRGTWGSQGEFTFSNGLKDTGNAINFLLNDEVAKKYRIDTSKISIVGYSMGAFFGMINSINFPQIEKLAFVTGFNFGLFAKLMPSIENAEQLTKESLAKGSYILSNADPEKLFNDIKENSNKWDLVDLAGMFVAKQVNFIGAKYDTVAHLDIHHIPLVKTFKAYNIKTEEHILETGHGLATHRIQLASILVEWLKR